MLLFVFCVFDCAVCCLGKVGAARMISPSVSVWQVLLKSNVWKQRAIWKLMEGNSHICDKQIYLHVQHVLSLTENTRRVGDMGWFYEGQ